MALAEPQFATADEVGGHETPTARVLLVAEAIGRHGPITLNSLSDILPFHRSSIWRAANTLKAQGWVRMRPGDQAFELTSRLDVELSRFHFATADAESAQWLVAKVLSEEIFHVELSQFVSPGQCMMIESTCRSAERGARLSMVWDAPALAAQLVMYPAERRRHIKAFRARCSPAESEMILSPDHDANLHVLSREGIVWSPDELAGSIPWKGVSGTCGAVTVLVKSPSRRSRLKMKLLLRELVENQVELGIFDMTCAT